MLAIQELPGAIVFIMCDQQQFGLTLEDSVEGNRPQCSRRREMANRCSCPMTQIGKGMSHALSPRVSSALRSSRAADRIVTCRLIQDARCLW